ncbi:uncharacterized protein LOC109718450 [Ananas comosus]|uniref:Uncharacterized protein LOC109718450 n=1 Tax=Ananas comosus TaxID=4615 RepID=A0A6P5FVD5_ANACO|nr:uncharacterized protein LOC109718450 [Ananas comosus]
MRSAPAPAPDDDAASTSSASYWWRSAAGDAGVGGVRVVREMERVAAMAEERMDELRHRLVTYRAGDFWLPAGGISREDTDIPPVVALLLLGFAAAGKSSLVRHLYSVLGRASAFAPFPLTTSPAGKDGRTLCLEEHNVVRSTRNGFCVFDSRGLDYDRVADGLDEVADWMDHGVRHRQLCRGASASADSASSSSSSAAAAEKRFVRRRVNCVVVVASLSELYRSLLSADLRKLDATRELFHYPAIKTTCYEDPILVLTHGDELTPAERIDARVRVCDYLGVPDHACGAVYDVACPEGLHVADEVDPVAAYAAAEAVFRALHVADRAHPPKPGPKEWALWALTWSLCALSALFAFLSCLCSKFAQANNTNTNTNSSYSTTTTTTRLSTRDHPHPHPHPHPHRNKFR